MNQELVSAISEGEGECIEFKSEYKKGKVGKTICAFANTKGGRLYIGIHDEKTNYAYEERVIGVADPDDTISSVQNLANGCDPAVQIHVRKVSLDSNDTKGKAVVVVEVAERRSEHLHRYEKQFYKRVGEEDKPVSSAELTSLMKERSSFDEDLCYEFNYDDHFDQEKTLAMFKQNDSGDSKENPADLIVGAGAAVRRNGNIVFRNVGVLFFAKNLSVFYPHASIHCFCFSGLDEAGDIVAKKQFNEDLLSDVKKAMAFLKEHLNTEYRFPHDNMRREEILEVPPEALREAIVNAVTHRDYRERGVHTTIKVFDDRVEISNPCIYSEKVDIRDIGDSKRINPVIADFMGRAGYVERVRRGLTKMQQLTKSAGQPMTFSISNYCWKLIFPRKEFGQKILSNDVKFNFGDRSLTSKRADRLSNMLNLIVNREFEKDSFVKNRAISQRTVEEDLRYLKEAGLVTFEGTRQTGRYLVTEMYIRVSETGLSPTALEIAEVFVETSKEGSASELLLLSIAELESLVSIRDEKLLDALYEMEKNGFVRLSFAAGHSHPTHVKAHVELFVKLDHLWMPWNPDKDAKTISTDMIGEEGQEVTATQVAERYGWNMRRVNPALHIIRKHASRFIAPNFNMGEFQLPEFARHSWDRGKEAAKDFLQYANSSIDKENSRREVILLMCLRCAVTYLSHELYIDILQERTNIKGIPLGVYLASTPEKERKLKLFQYLQRLASDIEKEESEYNKEE